MVIQCANIRHLIMNNEHKRQNAHVEHLKSRPDRMKRKRNWPKPPNEIDYLRVWLLMIVSCRIKHDRDLFVRTIPMYFRDLIETLRLSNCFAFDQLRSFATTIIIITKICIRKSKRKNHKHLEQIWVRVIIKWLVDRVVNDQIAIVEKWSLQNVQWSTNRAPLNQMAISHWMRETSKECARSREARK